MRKAPLVIAVSSLALIAGAAFAASSPTTSSTPAAPPTSSSSSTTAPSASTGTSANTSATAGGFTVGETVKDNTGASIGTITDLKADASGKQQAVIKMGSDQFSVATANLGQANGAATINLTQAQITKMLHPGGAAEETPTPAAPGGSTGGPAGGATPPASATHGH